LLFLDDRHPVLNRLLAESGANFLEDGRLRSVTEARPFFGAQFDDFDTNNGQYERP